MLEIFHLAQLVHAPVIHAVAVAVGGLAVSGPVLCGVFPHGKPIVSLFHVGAHVSGPGKIAIRFDPFFRAFPVFPGGGTVDPAIRNFSHSQKENEVIYAYAFHSASEQVVD